MIQPAQTQNKSVQPSSGKKNPTKKCTYQKRIISGVRPDLVLRLDSTGRIISHQNSEASLGCDFLDLMH
jgi:hypothetical protein